MLKMECERCGAQAAPRGLVVTRGGVRPRARAELPSGWTRPVLETADGEMRERELCGGCKSGLLEFMAGTPALAVEARA